MGQLTDALVERVRRGAEVRSGAHAARVEARGDRWAIVEADAERIVDAVVIATTAATAAPILAPLAGEAAGALGSATTVSSTTVTLAYPRDAIDHPLDGTGFVVAASHQEHGFRACTFVTSKFAGRAPDGLVTLRAFFRPTPEDLASLSREGWIDRAAASLARVLAVRTAPSRAWVTTWASALPVFDRTHADRVRALEAALPRGVLLAGSAFHGSGIDAAVRSAEAAAKALG
jgi:oxygen-dependent protoporphyrinogen oxidase